MGNMMNCAVNSLQVQIKCELSSDLNEKWTAKFCENLYHIGTSLFISIFFH